MRGKSKVKSPHFATSFAKASKVKKASRGKQKLKVILICFFIVFVLVITTAVTVYAQINTSTPSPTLTNPTKSVEDKEIQTLKEKIATKVAELREKNSKAISGIVQEINTAKTVIKIKTWKEEDFEIKVDPDLTKFYQISGSQKKEVESVTVKKGSYIIVTGLIKDKSVEANFIYLDELFIVGLGKVTEVNKDDFFISAITTDKENYTLDIETLTKQQMLNIKTLKIENVGFSKIKEGDTIHFVVKKTESNLAIVEKELNRFSAQKFLIIPQEYFIK